MRDYYRYTSPSFIKASLDSMGKKPTKGLGQNFLIDESVVDNIIKHANLQKDVAVLEIGTGLGSLTYKLIKACGRVVSVEIDDKLWAYLDSEFGHWDNFELIKGDILKVDIKAILSDLSKDYSKIYVVANLPYHISTPIIMMFLEMSLPINRLVVMMQRELAMRITASSSCKDYGSLTVNLNSFADASILFDIKPHSFMPAPKVSSSVVSIDLHENAWISDEDRAFFIELVKAAFHARRKKLVNSVNGIMGMDKFLIETTLQNIGVRADARAETLSPEQFRKLASALKNKLTSSNV